MCLIIWILFQLEYSIWMTEVQQCRQVFYPHKYKSVLSIPAKCPAYTSLLAAIHKLAAINLVPVACALFTKTRPKVNPALMLIQTIPSNRKERNGVTNLVIRAWVMD